MSPKHYPNYLLLFSSLLLFIIIYSSANAALPRILATGLTGTDTLGLADIMIPLLGNQQGNLYTDIQAKVGDDHAWMGSIGLGSRQVIHNADIFGAYIFIDHNQTRNKKQFWVLSPGIEVLGQYWNFHGNAYIPVGRKKVLINTVSGAELGLNAQTVTFSGHQQFDQLFNYYEKIGTGIDAEVGYIFPQLQKLAIYAGGYYFNLTHHAAIRGVEVRTEFPLSKYATLLANDSYDNHAHNTLQVGIRFSFGAMPTTHAVTYDIHQHLLDPISRNLGTLHTGSGIPSVKVRKKGPRVLVRDNIWFFT